MKKRLTGKPACVAILTVLLIISIVDVVLRSAIFSFDAITISNVGEPFITVLFSAMLLIFANKGKDRLFYILCGAFLGYFVLNQLFELPSQISFFISDIFQRSGFALGRIAVLAHILVMVCIVAIGGLLVEYMNDGSIYNKAFNILCVIVVVLCLVQIVIGIVDTVAFGPYLVFAVVNTLSKIATVFLFVYYSYDSAKKQLAKTKLSE